MAEYIEREALLNHLKHRVAPMSDGEQLIKGVNLALGILEEAVAMLPAADVAPVVHGQWIKRRYGLRKIYYHCSHCHFGLSKIGDDHYCNYCGAKMDEEENND